MSMGGKFEKFPFLCENRNTENKEKVKCLEKNQYVFKTKKEFQQNFDEKYSLKIFKMSVENTQARLKVFYLKKINIDRNLNAFKRR